MKQYSYLMDSKNVRTRIKLATTSERVSNENKKTLTIKTVQQGLSSASIRKGGIALKQAPLEACFQVIILVT